MAVSDKHSPVSEPGMCFSLILPPVPPEVYPAAKRARLGRGGVRSATNEDQDEAAGHD